MCIQLMQEEIVSKISSAVKALGMISERDLGEYVKVILQQVFIYILSHL
jgi:hypothetical protein